MNQLTCDSELRTHVGNVRPYNEDAALAMDSAGLWIVADGMGGHQAGDYASKTIVNSLSSLNPTACLADVVEQVEDDLTAVNKQLISYADKTYDGLGKVGSTVACLVIRDGVSVAIWSGDSRVYLWRDQQLKMMTRDHTRVQDLLDHGHLTPRQAEQSHFRNVLTRAVGVHEDFFLDINAVSVQRGDRFLICSDGLYNEVSREAICQMFKDKEINKVADNLMAKVLGGDARDNVTLILVEVY